MSAAVFFAKNHGSKISHDKTTTLVIFNSEEEPKRLVMQIENAVYYHTHRLNYHSENWLAGNELEFGSTYNYYFDELLKSVDEVFIDHERKSFFDETNKWVEDQRGYWLRANENEFEDRWNILEHFSNAVEKVHDYNLHLQKHRQLLFENCFEHVRSSNFSELPSRQKCLWVCNEQHLKLWQGLFDGSNLRTYKLLLTGSIHAVDGSLIASDIYSVNEFERLAFQYWRGELNLEESERKPEYLFEGHCKIVKVINN